MKTLLVFLAGMLAGGIVGWLVALRFAREPRTSVVPPMPDELIGSDTATHLAASIPADSTFEPLAYVLIERCAAQIGMPCALVMREKPGAAAYIAAVAGGLDSRLMGVEVHLDSPAGRALTEGVPVVGAPDEKVIHIDRGDRRRYEGGGIAVPLGQGGQIYGAIVAFGESRNAREAVELLSLESRKFAPVIIPAYSAAISARRAETDELTGLANRRVLQRAQSRVDGRERASLLIIDIDHFKAINDRYGHPAGDGVLKRVARTVSAHAREEFIIARIGGEEFAAVLPEHTVEEAAEFAERLSQAIADNDMSKDGGPKRVTVSIGAAEWLAGMMGSSDLLRAADEQLYRAKQEGRNSVRRTGT